MRVCWATFLAIQINFCQCEAIIETLIMIIIRVLKHFKIRVYPIFAKCKIRHVVDLFIYHRAKKLFQLSQMPLMPLPMLFELRRSAWGGFNISIKFIHLVLEALYRLLQPLHVLLLFWIIRPLVCTISESHLGVCFCLQIALQITEPEHVRFNGLPRVVQPTDLFWISYLI